MNEGDVIISYRGTDDLDATLENIIPDDIEYGWGPGGGSTGSEQGEMVLEFYQEVAGEGNWQSADIELTGHSMGGGFAGYVGALYDQDATSR